MKVRENEAWKIFWQELFRVYKKFNGFYNFKFLTN